MNNNNELTKKKKTRAMTIKKLIKNRRILY